MSKIIYKFHCFDDKLLSKYVIKEPTSFADLNGIVSFSRRDMIRSLRLGSEQAIDHAAVLSFWCSIMRYIKRYTNNIILITNESKIPMSLVDTLFLPSRKYETYKDYEAGIRSLQVQAENARRSVVFCDSDQDYVNKFLSLYGDMLERNTIKA